MKTTGKVTGIVSNLVTVQVDGPVAENELCYITLDGTPLLAEVIKVAGNKASVQVFESTRGLKNGDSVEFEGRMLEVSLGPGLLSSVYDGLQNNLATMDSVFLRRGSTRILSTTLRTGNSPRWQRSETRWRPQTGSERSRKAGSLTKSWCLSRSRESTP